MASRRAGLSRTETQHEAPVQQRVGKVHSTTIVQHLEQAAIDIVLASIAKADQVQARLCHQFQAGIGANIGRELRSHRHLLPNVATQSLQPKASQDEP